MKIEVFPDTFSATAEEEIDGFQKGTVEIALQRGRVTVEAGRFKGGDLILRGFVGRYRTSNNPWRASVVYRVEQKSLFADFGRDDRSGRFQKIDLISYEPETYATAKR